MQARRPAPASLPGAVDPSPLISITDAAALVTLPGQGRLLVDRSGVIGATVAADADLDDLVAAVRPTVAAAAALLRGRFPMRGSLVERNGKAVLLCGRGGAGTSTLATALTAEGWVVAADGVVACRLDRDVARADRNGAGVDLWPDAVTRLRRLGLDLPSGVPVRRDLAKRRYEVGPSRSGDEVTVEGVVVLADDLPDGSAPAVAVDRIGPGAGIAGILASQLLKPAIAGLGRTAEHLAWVQVMAATDLRLVRRTPAWPDTGLVPLLEGWRRA